MSQRSATASNARPESLSLRSTSFLTSCGTTLAYVQLQYRIFTLCPERPS